MDKNQYNELLNNIKNGNEASPDAIEDFVSRNLSASQATALNNVLKNPDLIKQLLQSPQARSLMEKFGKKEN